MNEIGEVFGFSPQTFWQKISQINFLKIFANEYGNI